MITPDKSWDLSGTIQLSDTNSNEFTTKITGRLNPSTTTPEKAQTLFTALASLTTNTYIDTKLTAQKSLNSLVNEDDEEELPFTTD